MTIKLLTTGIALFLSCIASAQNFEVPALPATKEKFIKSEPDILAAGKAIETNKESMSEDWVKEKLKSK